ncbi:polyhomeotic-like protein 2 isoform X2 [Liolophura sinensis]|uniref:polyhomeotic-like protein 2 isoform X2 n=1 Tax=Liolophura sinensis TaxID=3198878 RepID=UPI003158CE6D
MSADQRQNNGGGGPPTNHNNNNTNANNNNNNNNAMNPGMPVGMHGLQPGMASMQASLQAGMPGAMQGMPASLQASMQSGMRSPVSQVQLIHSPLPGPPYLSQFPYNQQLMLQNAAVQAAMQAQMSQQLNLAMQGRPPSVSPKSPSLPVLSPSPSATQAQMSMAGTSTSSSSSTSTSSQGGSNGSKSHTSKAGSNSNQAQVAAMMAGKATMIPRQAQAAQPIVIGQIGVVPGQPVSTAGFLPQGCDPSQLINSQAQQLRLTSQQQLVTSTGQIITSQPMLTNQAVLQAMASLQQQGIPIAHQPLLGTQTPSLIPGQPLFIRPAGPMQPQQNMMAAAAANVQNMNAMKGQKPVDTPTNLQTKPSNNPSGKSPSAGQGRNLTILPSTSRPGVSTARVNPTSMHSLSQATKLNIPQVTPKLNKTKARSHSSKTTSTSTSQSKTNPTNSQAKTATTSTSSANGTVGTPSKSQSGSESDASKKASPSTPPAVPVPRPAELPKEKVPTASVAASKSITEKVVEQAAVDKGALPADREQQEEDMEVEKAPEPKKDVVVEKQRAIVKPHILTHVIEGFIIQEGPEPFPVQRSSLLTDFIPPKHNNAEAKDSEDDHSPYAFRDPTPEEMLNRPQGVEERDLHIQPAPGPLPTLKCEFCGKVAKAEKFRCSKRFCSTTCAKRYNVGCSRRLSLFKSSSSKDSSETKHLVRSVSMPAGRCMRKRKPAGLRMRKSWRSGRGGRMSFNSLSSQPLEDNSSSRSEHESSSSVGSPSPPQEFEMETDEPNPQSNPSKWTVQDVYDFINSITGCATYAEEFKAQEIDGQALLLLKEDHLMTTMNMKLGPALKICARINSLKDDYV